MWYESVPKWGRLCSQIGQIWMQMSFSIWWQVRKWKEICFFAMVFLRCLTAVTSCNLHVPALSLFFFNNCKRGEQWFLHSVCHELIYSKPLHRHHTVRHLSNLFFCRIYQIFPWFRYYHTYHIWFICVISGCVHECVRREMWFPHHPHSQLLLMAQFDIHISTRLHTVKETKPEISTR